MTRPMDPEILAIKRTLKVIEPFNEETRRRIIQYVVSYFGWPGMRKLYDSEDVCDQGNAPLPMGLGHCPEEE